jgi:protease-4
MAGRTLMTEDAVRALADGRIYSGEEARMLGLVDKLGGFSEAVRQAQILGGLPLTKEPTIVYEDGQSSFFGQLFGKAFSFLDPMRSTLSPGITMKFIYHPGL